MQKHEYTFGADTLYMLFRYDNAIPLAPFICVCRGTMGPTILRSSHGWTGHAHG